MFLIVLKNLILFTYRYKKRHKTHGKDKNVTGK